MSNFRKVLIIIFLCVAVILITGILLPKYLSTQLLELRKELNSQSSNSKYNLQSNLIPVAEKRTQSERNSSNSSKNAETFPRIVSNSIFLPEKVQKRSKRQAVSDDEHFHWNFNFNLTGQRNHASQVSSEIMPNTSHKDTHLAIALYTEGEVKRKFAFDEIQHLLKAVEYFFGYLFSASNITNNVSKNELSPDENLADLEGGSDDPSTRGRKGKFFDFRKIFGFRISPEKSVSTSTVSGIESVILRDDLITVSPTVDITENSQELHKLSNFQAQSLISEAFNAENRSSISESSLPGKTEDGECIGCDAVGLETPESSKFANKTNEQSKIVLNSTEFTDEFLEMFCMSLVKKVGVSQHLSDFQESSFEPKQNVIDEHISSSPEHPVTDLIQTSISEELNPEFISETIFMSNDTSTFVNEMRQKLSLSSFLGFGSGRAATDQDELNEFTFANFSDVDLGNLPTLLDCENYYRKNLEMFPKPNLMDIMSDPKINFQDVANANVSNNVKEQQLQYLINLLKNHSDNSLEPVVKNSEVTNSVSSKIIPENDLSSHNEVQKDILMHTESNDLGGNTKALITSTDVDEAPQITELERDGRFINLFGFGSGESRSFGTDDFDTDGNKIFGSGDLKSFQKIDNVGDYEFDNKFESGDSRSIWATLFGTNKDELGSGDSRTFEAAATKVDNEFGSGDSRSFWAALFGTNKNELGSGDPRSLEAAATKVNEFGSGDSRSLWATLFGTNKDEFGSGDSRSFEGVNSKTGNEFASGDLRSLSIALLGTVKNESGSGDSRFLVSGTGVTESDEFGSGDSRSLDATSGIDGSELESGDFFKETSDFTTDSNEDLRFLSSNKRRIWGMLGLAGSGDGRDLPENLEVSHREKICENCSSEITIPQQNDCGDHGCNLGNYDVSDINLFEDYEVTASANLETSSYSANADAKEGPDYVENASDTQNGTEDLKERSTDRNVQRFLRPVFLTGSGAGGLFGDSGGTINLLEEDESTSADTRNENIDVENTGSKLKISFEKSRDEQTTETNSQRFLGPIILTGSDDGLVEGSGEPINQLEKNTGKSQVFSARKSRLDDSPQNFSQIYPESFLKQSEQENTIDGNVNKENSTSPIKPLRRGRVEEGTDDHCDSCEYDYEDFIENYRKQLSNSNKDLSQFKKRTNEMPLANENFTVITAPDVSQSNISVSSDLTKLSPFQMRPCTAARECNVTLNERCITKNSSRVCGCSKGYARNKETGKCIVMKIVETSIKMPAERFEEDLKNPFSPGFQRKRKFIVELVMASLQNNPETLRVLSEIGVEFSAGSLVVKLNLVFAAENKSQEQLIQQVENDFQIALRNETLMKRIPLNVSEASLVSVNGDIDYCKSSDLNYCSENAYCVSNPGFPSSYACQCKEHYRDASFDPNRNGETCIEKCPKEYCGAYGHCELLSNERICLCTGLYFGRRCEVPGLYVLIALAFVGFVSITMLLLVIFKRRCSRFSYRESQAREADENGIHSHMNGKLSDTIALEENIGTTKFVSISTPVPHPAIRIIRPTITESGSSYEFDSTFDTTPPPIVEENSAV